MLASSPNAARSFGVGSVLSTVSPPVVTSAIASPVFPQSSYGAGPATLTDGLAVPHTFSLTSSTPHVSDVSDVGCGAEDGACEGEAAAEEGEGEGEGDEEGEGERVEAALADVGATGSGGGGGGDVGCGGLHAAAPIQKRMRERSVLANIGRA